MRFRLPVLHDLQQRGRRGWIADAAERAHRLDRDRAFGARRPAGSAGRRQASRWPVQLASRLQQPQALDRERARVRIGVPGQRQERVSARLSSSRCSAKATGHQRTRGCPPIEHGGGELVVRLQSHEREHAESERRGRRVARARRRLRRAVWRARPTPRSARSSGRSAPPPPGRRSGRALRRRCPSPAATDPPARDQRIARAPVADQSERERRHLPHFGIRVAEQRQQRLDAFREPDAADRQRRAAPDARFLVAEQPRSDRACGGGGGGATATGGCPRAGRPAAAAGRQRAARPDRAARADPRAAGSTPSSVRTSDRPAWPAGAAARAAGGALAHAAVTNASVSTIEQRVIGASPGCGRREPGSPDASASARGSEAWQVRARLRRP